MLAFNPPPIRGLGTAGGFEVYVQDRADADPQKLCQRAAATFTGELRKRPELTGINTFFRPTVPQLLVDVDREKAIALGVPVNDVFDALQSTMGALYVNDFNMFGRTYRVQLQADAPYRAQARGPRQRLRALAPRGEMIPLKALITRRAASSAPSSSTASTASSPPRCSATARRA